MGAAFAVAPYAWAESPSAHQVTFVDMAQSAGITFQHDNAATQEKYLIETMGSGCGWIDYDQNGLLDLYLVNGAATGIYSPKHPLRSALYRNNGDGTFTDVTLKAGVGAEGLFGMGVAVGDYDNDGFPDLLVLGYGRCILYHNNGDGTFTDVTPRAGVENLGRWASSAAWFDYDNDGRLDFVIANYVDWSPEHNFYCGDKGPGMRSYCHPDDFRPQPPTLFHNNGDGTFSDVSKSSGVGMKGGNGLGVVTFDYDNDGWQDIFIANDHMQNFQFHNNRDGTFRDVTAESGLDRNNTRYSFCCGWSDYNQDGWPDLYVVNDFGRKNLYRNNGDGTFTDVAAQVGVDDVGAGMSVCWFDYDNDGAQDLYVTDMWSAAGQRVSTQEVFQKDASEAVRAQYRKHARGNSLLQNSASGKFQDTSASAGVEMGRWSWSSDAWDFDHDGFPDLYITNGMVSGPSRADLNSFFWRQVVAHSPGEAKPKHDYEQGWNAINELIRSDGTWSGFERNVFYANNRDGTFSDVSGVVGLDFLEDGRSFALADFDHDGRLEVFLKNRNAPQLRLLENVMKELEPSIVFRLRGTKSNRDAIGAVMTLEAESGRQTRMLQAGSGFLSQHTKEIFFGLGKAGGPVRASIRWPSGTVQELRDLPVNHRVWVEEGSAPSRMERFKIRASTASEAMPDPRPILTATNLQQTNEPLPATVETWLVAPVAAPNFSLPDVAGQTRTLVALRGKAVLLKFCAAGSEGDLEVLNRLHTRLSARGLQVLAINVDDSADPNKLRTLVRERNLSFPILHGSDDVAGIYNILYRHLFDRHRDLCLPTSFLIDQKGDVVKVYQGPIDPEHVELDFRHIPRTATERLAKGLPFSGVSETPEFRRNYLSYGSDFFQHEYFDQAEASFRLALRDEPSAEAWYGLGSVYLKQQKNAEARKSFERATKSPASYPETLPNAWNNLGLLLTREGRTAEAIPYFQEALRLNADHLIALENLGNAYRQEKQWEEARKVLQRAVEVGPQDPEANYSLGMVFAQLDDSQRAFEYLQRALKFRPAYPEALNNLGVLYLRTRRRDEAVASFEECIRVAAGFDQSYLNLARVYAIEGKADKARSVLLELLKQHPDHAAAQKALAQLPQ